MNCDCLFQVGIPGFVNGKLRHLSNHLLRQMNFAQIQLVVNDLHTQIEGRISFPHSLNFYLSTNNFYQLTNHFLMFDDDYDSFVCYEITSHCY